MWQWTNYKEAIQLWFMYIWHMHQEMIAGTRQHFVNYVIKFILIKMPRGHCFHGPSEDARTENTSNASRSEIILFSLVYLYIINMPVWLTHSPSIEYLAVFVFFISICTTNIVYRSPFMSVLLWEPMSTKPHRYLSQLLFDNIL